MLGKMIGAIVGGNIAEKTRGVSGPTGAVLGAAVPALIARMSLPTMIAMGVGGYFVKKHLDKKAAAENAYAPKPVNTPTIGAPASI